MAHSVRVSGLAVLLPAWLLLAAAPLFAGDDPGARLRAMLTGKERIDNTIPLEQEVMKLRVAKEAQVLAEFLDNEQYGWLCFWGLTEIADPATEEVALAAFAKMPVEQRAEYATYLATFRSDGARKALRALAAEKGLPRIAATRWAPPSSARARRGGALAGPEGDRGTDANAAARALLLAGDARAEEFLPAAAKLAADARPVAPPVPSISRSPPAPRTRRRLHGHLDPPRTRDPRRGGRRGREPDGPAHDAEMIAWWYEPEKGARFSADDAGKALLAAWIEADAKAAKASAPGAAAAVAALFAHLRQANPEMCDAKITGVSFADGFTFTGLVNGDEMTAKISGDLKVVLGK